MKPKGFIFLLFFKKGLALSSHFGILVSVRLWRITQVAEGGGLENR